VRAGEASAQPVFVEHHHGVIVSQKILIEKNPWEDSNDFGHILKAF
jgi:hypothetical protein